MRYLLLVISLFILLPVQAQQTLENILLENQLRFVYKKTQSSNLQVSFVIKTGVSYETQSQFGYTELLSQYLMRELAPGTQVKLVPEYLELSYSGKATDINSWLGSLMTAISNLSLSDLNTQTILLSDYYPNLSDAAALALWETQEAAFKLGKPIGAQNIELSEATLKEYKSQFLHPNNAALVFCGNLNYLDAYLMVKNKLGSWKASSFKAISSKQQPNVISLSTTQRFYSQSETPHWTSYWVGPNTRRSQEATYAAQLLSHYVSAASNLQSWQLNYSLSKYNGLITLSTNADSEAGEELLLPFLQTLSKPDSYSQQVLDFAKNQLIQEWEANECHNISKAYALATVDYYTQFADNIIALTAEDLAIFCKRYLLDIGHVISASGSNTDAQPAITDSLANNLVLDFGLNTYKLNQGDNVEQLELLVEYLKLNPQILIQVNAGADKSEYLKVKDEGLDAFLRGLENFELVANNQLTEKYIRLDMARALQVIRYLLSNGIETKRITGTGTLYDGDSDAEKANNRLLNFSYEVMHPHAWGISTTPQVLDSNSIIPVPKELLPAVTKPVLNTEPQRDTTKVVVGNVPKQEAILEVEETVTTEEEMAEVEETEEIEASPVQDEEAEIAENPITEEAPIQEEEVEEIEEEVIEEIVEDVQSQEEAIEEITEEVIEEQVEEATQESITEEVVEEETTSPELPERPAETEAPLMVEEVEAPEAENAISLKFAPGMVKLSIEQQTELMNAIEQFKTAKQININGYAYDTPNAYSNKKIAKNRAENTQKALVSMGVPVSKIKLTHTAGPKVSEDKWYLVEILF